MPDVQVKIISQPANPSGCRRLREAAAAGFLLLQNFLIPVCQRVHLAKSRRWKLGVLCVCVYVCSDGILTWLADF